MFIFVRVTSASHQYEKGLVLTYLASHLTVMKSATSVNPFAYILYLLIQFSSVTLTLC